MDWNNATIAAVAGTFFGGILVMTAMKMRQDLLPKGKIFTVRGMVIGGVLIGFGLASWPIIQASRGDDIGAAIAAVVLSLLAFSVGICALVGTMGWYQIHLLKGRVTAIEQHVGLSKSQ